MHAETGTTADAIIAALYKSVAGADDAENADVSTQYQERSTRLWDRLADVDRCIRNGPRTCAAGGKAEPKTGVKAETLDEVAGRMVRATLRRSAVVP